MKALDNLQSPHLLALQQHLRNGNNAAIASFWQELEAQGTPLVPHRLYTIALSAYV